MGFLLGYMAGNSGNVGAGLAAIAESCANHACNGDMFWFNIVMGTIIAALGCLIIFLIVAPFIWGWDMFSLAASSSFPPPRVPPAPRPQWRAGVYRVTALRLGVPTIVYRED